MSKTKIFSLVAIGIAAALTLSACSFNTPTTTSSPQKSSGVTNSSSPSSSPSASSAPSSSADGTLVGSVTADGVKYDVYSVGTATTTKDSDYTLNGVNAYPSGSVDQLLEYKITNVSNATVDIYGLNTDVSKYFTGGTYAYSNYDDGDGALKAKGLATDLYAKYGFDAKTWPLNPGETVSYGEGWYNNPTRDGDLTLIFQDQANEDKSSSDAPQVVVSFK